MGIANTDFHTDLGEILANARRGSVRIHIDEDGKKQRIQRAFYLRIYDGMHWKDRSTRFSSDDESVWYMEGGPRSWTEYVDGVTDLVTSILNEPGMKRIWIEAMASEEGKKPAAIASGNFYAEGIPVDDGSATPSATNVQDSEVTRLVAENTELRNQIMRLHSMVSRLSEAQVDLAIKSGKLVTDDRDNMHRLMGAVAALDTMPAIPGGDPVRQQMALTLVKHLDALFSRIMERLGNLPNMPAGSAVPGAAPTDGIQDGDLDSLKRILGHMLAGSYPKDRQDMMVSTVKQFVMDAMSQGKVT